MGRSDLTASLQLLWKARWFGGSQITPEGPPQWPGERSQDSSYVATSPTTPGALGVAPDPRSVQMVRPHPFSAPKTRPAPPPRPGDTGGYLSPGGLSGHHCDGLAGPH